VPSADRDWSRHFVDLQRDVTVADLRSAVAAGLRSAEHVKRRTTLGTGRDQGRTANDLARGVLAELTGAEPESVVPARQRPPATPVSFAVMAGRERGRLHDPIRRTPLHSWHEAHGAPFEDVGRWKRPLGYPRDGEDLEAATLRECRAVREDVGILDASTLGKIDVRGPDAAELLERLCATRIGTLGPGRCRYVVICGVDGMVLDDGVAMRLAPEHFVLTTTSGNAPLLLDWMEEWLQTEWPELDVHLTSVTDHWAVIAIAGPRARDLLRPLAREAALDRDAFAFMAVRETVVGGVGARLARVSFCGELAFELHVPARHAPGLWVALVQAGATPYGTEAMHVLRAEKGYPIIGQDTDGTVTPQDLGLDFAVADKPFVGRRSHDRPDARRTGRRRLVGLLPDDPDEQLVEGAALIATADASRVQGHVTSSYRSAALGRTFALGLLEDGVRRIGQRVMATTTAAGAAVPVTVHTSVFYDPEGRRRDGDDDLDAVR
jgi:sarcosine oxidase subunit alpha